MSESNLTQSILYKRRKFATEKHVLCNSKCINKQLLVTTEVYDKTAKQHETRKGKDIGITSKNPTLDGPQNKYPVVCLLHCWVTLPSCLFYKQ